MLGAVGLAVEVPERLINAVIQASKRIKNEKIFSIQWHHQRHYLPIKTSVYNPYVNPFVDNFSDGAWYSSIWVPWL